MSSTSIPWRAKCPCSAREAPGQGTGHWDSTPVEPGRAPWAFSARLRAFGQGRSRARRRPQRQSRPERHGGWCRPFWAGFRIANGVVIERGLQADLRFMMESPLCGRSPQVQIAVAQSLIDFARWRATGWPRAQSRRLPVGSSRACRSSVILRQAQDDRGRHAKEQRKDRA
jgi:hypothetical protein